MSTPQIVVLAANTETAFSSTPFVPGQPVQYHSEAGGEVYAVNLPAKNSRSGKYQKFVGDGSKASWSTSDLVNLANADNPASITAADRLRVVVKVNGELLTRVNGNATATGSQFNVDNLTGALEFGTAPAAGATVELFLVDAADIVNITLAAAVPQEGPAYEVVASAVAAQAIRLCP